MLPTVAAAYTYEQQQACTGDAFKFCSADIPHIDRITACMIRNKAQLSPACRAQFPAGGQSAGLGMATADSSVADKAARKPSSWRLRKKKQDDDE